MLKSFLLASSGCFEIYFVAAWVVLILFGWRWIRTRKMVPPEMLLLALCFLGMLFWRLLVRIFASRYAIGIAIPAVAMLPAVFYYDCWRNKKFAVWFRFLLAIAIAALVLAIFIRVFTVRSDFADYRDLGNRLGLQCADADQLAILSSSSHGTRVVYYMDLTKPPALFQWCIGTEKLMGGIAKGLEEADRVLVIVLRQDPARAEVEKRLRLLGVPISEVSGKKHIGYILDNRNAYHWGSEKAATQLPEPGNVVFQEDFETPMALLPSAGSDLMRFQNTGYPFFENGTFFFVTSLRPVFHGDLKPENRDHSELKLNRRAEGEMVLGGNYSCRIKTPEYFTFRAKELDAGKRYRFDVDFIGEPGGSLKLQALFVNQSGKFETRELGSFKILKGGVLLHGSFEKNTEDIASRNGQFILQLTVQGDLTFDNLRIASLP